MAAAGTNDPAAHEEYLIGRFHLWKFSQDHLTRAIEHFERATARDPGYANAHAGLAYAWWVRGVFGTTGLKQAEAPARAAARRALELDDRLAEAYAVQGYLECIYDWNWTGAERTLRRALELDPNNVDAHYTYALLLMALGRSEEALTQIERAAERDPFSPQIHSTFGRILYRARRFEEAVSRLKHAIALDPPNRQAHARLGDVYEQMGRFPEALAAYERANALAGAHPYDARVARVYARMGRLNEARHILDVLKARPAGEPLVAAGAYAALGHTDDAFRLLFRNVDERGELGIFVRQDPPLERLHTDPRWPLLLGRMNFPQ